MNRSEAGKLGATAGLAGFRAYCQRLRDDYKNNPKSCNFCLQILPWEKRGHKFCNHACAARANKNRKGTGSVSREKSDRTRAPGKWTPFELLRDDKTRKRRLIKERGHRCEKCSLDSWLGLQIVLTLEHIDGNSDNGEKSNLKLLCWNCHAQTPTFGAKNAGKFPLSIRRKRMLRSTQKFLEKNSI